MGIQSDRYASYKLLANELKRKKYTVSEEYEDSKLYVRYESPSGMMWRARAATLDYPSTPETVRALSKNKAEATKFAVDRDINAPATLTLFVAQYDAGVAEAFLNLHKRVVVKPLNRSLSIGLTTDIKTNQKLHAAIKKAGQYSDQIVIQQQVFGEEIRFAVLDGKVVSALLRRTPRVTGDGVSTIEQLIKAENTARKKIKNTYVAYPLIDDTLIRKSLDKTLVPRKGELVELSRSTMISKGCSVYDVLEDVDRSYIQLVEMLTEGLEAGFIVADIFVENYTVPATKNNYWFIEFNTAPVLKLFYSCRDGNMHDIVPQLAESLDKELHKTLRPILGGFEEVSLPEFGLNGVVAKIDTGAYSGALGCSEITLVQQQGKQMLRFVPGKNRKRSYLTDRFSTKYVRSSNGKQEKRYLIETSVLIDAKPYPITIGLTDRSQMKHEILIGRRFIREHNMLVDVMLNQEYDTDSEAK